MEYMITLHSPEGLAPTPDSPDFGAFMGEWMAYNQKLIDGGHWISAANLQPSLTATTIRRSPGGSDAITDGPFAETKEQFGGYYLISAANLDEALVLAAAIPLPVGSIEVRPVAYRPTADPDAAVPETAAS